MPENPFLKYQSYETKPPRNTNDLSHRYNGTFGFGTLYPVLCAEVNPGETFKIDAAVGLKFMPMPFPVQTPMHATMHFFYVRNRTIWKDFPDFIYNNKSSSEVPHPYISRPGSDKEFWSTGKIADYLDVPTVVVRPGHSSIVVTSVRGLAPNGGSILEFNSGSLGVYETNGNPSVHSSKPRAFTIQYPVGALFDQGLGMMLRQLICLGLDAFLDETTKYRGYLLGRYDYPMTSNAEIVFADYNALSTFIDAGEQDVSVFIFADTDGNPANSVLTYKIGGKLNLLHEGESYIPKLNFVFPSDFPAGMKYWIFFGNNSEQADGKYYFYDLPYSTLSTTTPFIGFSAQANIVASSGVDIADYPDGNPFSAENIASTGLGISALPFRCYESIYNAYYRNERLEPLMIDGVPEYNKFCPSMDSGADTFEYRLHQRNWEADFLTTALPTPQQGIAPVVGVVGLSNIQIQDPDTNKIYNFTAEVDDGDGETIVGGSFHNPDASLAARRTAQDIVTAGFTINDFRNVSALQRWLENNLRRGLKYRDQVLANTGVKPRYDELDMPEFIGGFSRPVQVAAITQTAPGGDAGLGDYAGQANCFGSSKHTISHYCDEAGFIMGILCVTPVPVYSQLLPKHFLKRSPLDYHHPAFNHIGMQPITYDQVAPLQVYAANPSQASTGVKFTDVFGYQRPWYDLLAKVDTVHGQMRTSLRDYVMNRMFDGVPQLGASFIHVDPEQLNDVFNVTDAKGDVIMGEIYFRIYAQRPVSLFAQPKIV